MSLEDHYVVDQHRRIDFTAQAGPPKSDLPSGFTDVPRLLKVAGISPELPVDLANFSLGFIFHSSKLSVSIFRNISVTCAAPT